MTSKEKEIKALTELVEMDGYFSEYFKNDLETMIGNIRNDFPIELDAKFHITEEQRQQSERESKTAHRNEIIDLCDTLLCINSETGNERAYDRAVEKLGLNFVIARKRQIGLELTSKEIDYLISQLPN